MQQIYKRFLSTGFPKLKKVQATNLKGKKKSSQEWIQRQLHDPYVKQAQVFNYRCRSAFKLLEIDDRFKIFHPEQEQIIIDCGAAPGSWSQVAKERSAPNCTIIAIDKSHLFPIEGVHILSNQDFTTAHEKLRELLNERMVHIVLSDMAPNATGIKMMDSENIVNLGYSVLKFAVTVCAPNASLLIKLWQCAEAQKLASDMSRFYENVKVVKPNASRSDSAEIFLLGRCFKGLSISKESPDVENS